MNDKELQVEPRSPQSLSTLQMISEDPPPPYSDTPTPEIALEPMFILNSPMTLRLVGHYTSPDFTLYNDSNNEMLAISTDSYLISHEMEFRELINGSNLFTVKRSNTGPGGQNWTYVANEPGRTGKRILELETRPDLLNEGGSSTRLTFRNKKRPLGNDDDGGGRSELDAVDLRLGSSNSATFGRAIDSLDSGFRSEVFYRDHKIGDIELILTRLKRPEFVINVRTSGIDPTLFVVLALALDDRAMSNRRRRRRPIGRNALGIGKGPGAGLTIPLVLSGGGGW